MITLDTSGLIALLETRDRPHDVCFKALRNDSGPYLIPATILAEIAWVLESRFHAGVERVFLDDFDPF